jgi:hypothetical protein
MKLLEISDVAYLKLEEVAQATGKSAAEVVEDAVTRYASRTLILAQ